MNNLYLYVLLVFEVIIIIILTITTEEKVKKCLMLKHPTAAQVLQ